MAAPEPAIDWKKHMKGKVLTQASFEELSRKLMPLYNTCNNRGRWDYRRMALTLNTAGLAAVLRDSNPARHSAEDRLEQVNNLIAMFEHLPPALVYGGVADAVLHLHSNSDKGWDCYELALGTLRRLLEGCAATPAGMEPFSGESLEAIAEAIGQYVLDTVEREGGLTPNRAQGLDHCLESIFSITRYRESPVAAVAREAFWDMDTPGHLLALGPSRPSAYGNADENVRDEGLDRFLASSCNIVRALSGLVQVPGPPQKVMQQHGKAIEYEGVFDNLKPLVQTACDLLYTEKFSDITEDSQEVGGAMLRNILSLVGFGCAWVHQDIITDLKNAGWEPLLQQIRDDRSYRGHYSSFFHKFAATLLAKLAKWKGRSEREAQELGSALMDITLSNTLSQSARLARQAEQPRERSQMEARRIVGQSVGPTGEPVQMFEVSVTARDYSRACASCGKKDSEEEGVTLRACSACHRERYCSRDCQVAHWKDHKAECKRYQRQQQDGSGAGPSSAH